MDLFAKLMTFAIFITLCLAGGLLLVPLFDWAYRTGGVFGTLCVVWGAVFFVGGSAVAWNHWKRRETG